MNNSVADKSSNGHQWDVFISHASEDKERFVRPLVKSLESLGLTAWFDEKELLLGKSLRRTIDHGLSRARFGVVILSKNFFAKEWPQKELDGLISREVDGVDVVLPVWWNVSRSDVASYSPTLADKLAILHGDDILQTAAHIVARVRQSRSASASLHEAQNHVQSVLTNAFTNDDPEMVDQALEMAQIAKMYEFKANIHLTKALASSLKSDDRHVQMQALRVVANQRKPDAGDHLILPQLRICLNSPLVDVSGLAIRAVSKLNDSYSISSLETIARTHENEQLRIQAMGAFAKLTARDSATRLIRILDKASDAERVAALASIQEERVTDDRLIAIMRSLAIREDASPELRMNALVVAIDRCSESYRKKTQQLIPTLLEKFTEVATDEELNDAVSAITEWCQSGVPETLDGHWLAEPLLNLLASHSIERGLTLAACLNLLTPASKKHCKSLRKRAWEFVFDLESEEFEDFSNGISRHLYHWSPVETEDTTSAIRLINKYGITSGWCALLWNSDSPEAAELALRCWEAEGKAGDLSGVNYFKRNPSELAVPMLTRVWSNSEDGLAGAAGLAMVQVGALAHRELLAAVAKKDTYWWIKRDVIAYYKNRPDSEMTSSDREVFELLLQHLQQ